jgi:hypothetical protein
MPTLEEALDELYGVPLDRFTATRNALAKGLTGDAAKQVKALKKPNIAAWALNQLPRHHVAMLDELFTATDALRRAQRRVMSGGKASDLRKATDDRNRVVSQLTKVAGDVLAKNGHAPTASTLAAVSNSLVAVASDDEGAELLRKGRLTKDLHPQSVVDVGGLTLVERDEEPDEEQLPDLGALEEAREAVDEARKRLKEAKAAVTEANREAERLAHEADRAERKAKAAREEAEFAKRAADARRSEEDDAEEVLREAQAALKAAQKG